MNHFITLQEAIDMTTLYRGNRETILDPEFKSQGILALSETFDREAFDTVLHQEGCVRLRIYYGMEENLKLHAVIVGVDDHDQDMLPDGNNDFEIIEAGQRNPPDSPAASDLNT